MCNRILLLHKVFHKKNNKTPIVGSGIYGFKFTVFKVFKNEMLTYKRVFLGVVLIDEIRFFCKLL